jgi:hypothetical protein
VAELGGLLVAQLGVAVAEHLEVGVAEAQLVVAVAGSARTAFSAYLTARSNLPRSNAMSLRPMSAAALPFHRSRAWL